MYNHGKIITLQLLSNHVNVTRSKLFLTRWLDTFISWCDYIRISTESEDDIGSRLAESLISASLEVDINIITPMLACRGDSLLKVN